MALLTELPPEIIHNVLRVFHYSVKGNPTVFRDVYLAHYDAPASVDDVDWERALKDVVRLQVVCSRQGADKKKDELSFVYETVNQLLQRASSDGERAAPSATYGHSRNAEFLSQLFANPENQKVFLEQSFLYERAHFKLPQHASFADPPKAEHQQSAKLHCLYGVPLLHSTRSGHGYATRATSKMGPFACSKVYDLRQYTERTRWGPFMDDGSDRTDWEKVEAIMLCLGSNLDKLGLNKFPICRQFWSVPFAGVWPGSYMRLPMLGPDKANQEGDEELDDPYGITGTWLRVVCFLDYTDFFHFNFNPDGDMPSNVPRRAISYGEATRLILMKISVSAVEPPGPDDGQALPVVHFKGVSRSLDDNWDENANSDMRGRGIEMKGTVRLTPEGEVRWTTWSLFNGQERWRSESVQVGGVRSAKGVLGNWFDKDYDPRGPAGPTAFWKISDQVSRGAERELMTDNHDGIDLPDGDYYPDEEVDDDEDGGEPEDEEDSEDGFGFGNIEDVEIEFVAGSAAEVAEIIARLQR
ncbi:hypothetical protein TruAng_008651 [Truncatella angustata]|nr:hypothetical protein TruAng_008651 [Truncatella angustata]